MNPTDKDPKTDAWLSQLSAADSGADAGDSYAPQLGRLIRHQQGYAEDSVDDISLRRGRNKLLDSLKATSRKKTIRWSRYAPPIAAALALIAVVPYLQQDDIAEGPSGTPHPEIIRSLGNLEIPRGGSLTIERTVDNPEQEAGRAADVLTDAGVTFELVSNGPNTFTLSLNLNAGNTGQELGELLDEFEVDTAQAGFVTVRFVQSGISN